MIKKVKIDYDRLCEELKKHGKSKEGFSVELGRGKSYISNLRRNPELPESMEKIICMILELEPGSLAEKSREDIGDVKILVNIYRKLGELEEMMASQGAAVDKLLSKANANTVQLEKIKDGVKNFGKTDYDRACEFLRNLLGTGRVNGEEVLIKSDASNIKRADLMKAKRDLQVDTETTGYGKNQKTWWFIPR